MALKIITYVIIGIAILIIFSLIVNILDSIAKFYTSKTKINDFMLERQKNGLKPSAPTINEKIITSINLLRLIDELVDQEITAVIQTCVNINSKYNSIHLDEDIKRLSTKVYDAIKPELLTSEDSLITSDYIIKYIMESITIKFIRSMNEFNSSILLNNNDKE